MAELSVREYEALMAVAQAALDAQGSRAWVQAVAEQTLGDLLHGEVFASVDLDYRNLTGTFATIRPAWAELRVPSGSPMHEDLLAGHPMTHHLGGRDALDVVRVSDLVPEQSWRHMPGYAKMRELIDATHQIGVTVEASPRRTFSISLMRAGTDFTEHEVTAARRLQPVLRAADRHVRMEDSQRRSRSVVDLAAADTVADDLGLTSRERVVLGVLSKGLTTGAAARRLGVSARTVAKHQEHIYRKLGVGDRVSAVLLAQRNGLLTQPTV